MTEFRELSDRIRSEVPFGPRDLSWIRRQARRRRNRRRAGVGAGVLAAVALVAVSLTVGGAPDVFRVEAVDGDGSTPVVASTVVTDQTRGGAADDPGTDPDGEATPTADRESLSPLPCGDWPQALDFWPDENPDAVQIVDSGDDTVQIRRAAFGNVEVELQRPLPARVAYGERVEPPPGQISTSFSSVGASITYISESFDFEEDPESIGEVPSILGLDFDVFRDAAPGCAGLVIRVFENGELVAEQGLDFAAAGDMIEGPAQMVFPAGPEWLDLGPVVTEKREATSVPEAGVCEGALPADPDHVVYRVDNAIAEPATVEEALAIGHLEVIDDPMAALASAGQTDVWVVAGAQGGEQSADMKTNYNTGFFIAIAPALYPDFIAAKETGDTSGPGLAGTFERPVDALIAFLDDPEGPSFIQSGWVEMSIDEATFAYGMPFDAGRQEWVSVVTVEGSAEGGWQVTGWTSAGC